MSRRKKSREVKPASPEEQRRALEHYFSIQLTPEQKASARAEVEKRVAENAANGVYKDLLAMRGKIKWSIPLEDLRDDD
jgi:hypothetical protein